MNSQETSTLSTKVQSMKRFITNENSGTFALPSGRTTKVGTKTVNSKHASANTTRDSVKMMQIATGNFHTRQSDTPKVPFDEINFNPNN